jgi:formylglycine-generating enzyme required for sulfatase activity
MQRKGATRMFLTLNGNSPALRFMPLLPFAAVLAAAAVWGLAPGQPAADFAAPQTISVLPKTVSYRMSGEFQLNGLPVDGQLQNVTLQAPVEIMKFQVSERQYVQCVSEAACGALDHRIDPGGGLPVTGVSFLDAEKYSAWLSRKTGDAWRLPADQEWAALAGLKYADDAIGPSQDASGPAQRWINRYEAESAKAGLPDPVVHASGHFGLNENGLADLSGNVWEWTSTCYTRSTLSAEGSVISAIDNCGVRVVEGKHRAYMTDFIRDAKTGGCAVGAPPDNLGIRLVREEPGIFTWQWLRRFFGSQGH